MPKAAVLGSPIAHSKSPLLHTAAYRMLGLAWTYERHDVDEAGFAPFLAAHAGEFRGLSLTMPLKGLGFERSETLDDNAMATGAVNTLVFGDTLQGYNTDVVGFIEALDAAGADVGDAACVIGTGATSRSAAFALARLGVRTIHLVGRRRAAVDAMVVWLAAFDVVGVPHAWDAPALEVPVTIATTVAGATDTRPIPENPGLLFDCIYAPWPTDFAARWSEAGGRVLGGLDLLVHQAAEQVILMTRVHPDNRLAIVRAMEDALRSMPTPA